MHFINGTFVHSWFQFILWRAPWISPFPVGGKYKSCRGCICRETDLSAVTGGGSWGWRELLNLVVSCSGDKCLLLT